MSALPAVPEGQPDPVTADAGVLDFLRESGVTVALDEAQLRELRDALHDAAAAGDRAASALRSIAGTEPAGIAQQLLRYVLMGSGYFVSARDTISALFHARAKVSRARKEKS